MMDIPIKDIKSGMKNLNVVFIVLDVGQPIITKDNRELRSCKVADSTASINISIWDEPSQYICPGDIIKITRGYASPFHDCLTLYVGKTGEIQKIGEFCMLFNEAVDMSAPNPNLSNQQYMPMTPTNVLASANGPAAPPPGPMNNSGRSGPPSGLSHKPHTVKNSGSSAMYNNSNNDSKNQSNRSNSRGRAPTSRR